MPFAPSVALSPEAAAGPTIRGFQASALAGVPRDRGVFSAATAGCSHGLCPPGVFRTGALTGISPGLLSRSWPVRS